MTSSTTSDILIAGAFAAFTVDLLVYPLDTLKTRIQSPDYASLYTNRPTGTVNRAALFRGLYQGIGSVVVATLPSAGAFFTTYEGMKYILAPLNSSLPTPIIHSFASAVAELVSCAILTPAEVIKQNAQVISSSSSRGPGNLRLASSSTLKVLSRLRRHPTRLWSGYTALAARNLPFTGLQFPMYEALKARMLGAKRDAAQMEPLRYASVTFLSAGIAGSIAATVTTPIDVLKTRIMLGAGENTEASKQSSSPRFREKGRSSALWSAGRDVYYKDGLLGFFRGGALRAGWTAIGLGLYLGSYEGGRMFLKNRRKERGRSLD